MKRIIFLLLIAISAIAFNACNNSNPQTAGEKETTSFYKVPLVCTAAPEIGCGTRSKPVLLELENKKDNVSEAWLNRTGTTIAIVWQEKSIREIRTAILDSVFNKNKMPVQEVGGEEYEKLLAEFQKKESWYRGSDVDKLSIEEAGVITARLINRINSKTTLAEETSENVRKEIAAVVQNGLTKNYTAQINSNAEMETGNLVQKIENDIVEVGKKYFNENEMTVLNEAIALGLTKPTEEETKSCTAGNSKRGCASVSMNFNFDKAFEGCQAGCGISNYNKADIVPMSEAKTGSITQCPVSGAIFLVKEHSPILRQDGLVFHSCCEACANRFSQDPVRFTQNVYKSLASKI